MTTKLNVHAQTMPHLHDGATWLAQPHCIRGPLWTNSWNVSPVLGATFPFICIHPLLTTYQLACE